MSGLTFFWQPAAARRRKTNEAKRFSGLKSIANAFWSISQNFAASAGNALADASTMLPRPFAIKNLDLGICFESITVITCQVFISIPIPMFKGIAKFMANVYA
jgi:hypothetical protein